MHETREAAIEQWVRAWFTERAPEIELKKEDNYFEKGAIDSFGVIELIEEMESHFSVRFTEQDFQDRRFATLIGLVQILREKGND